MGNRASGRRDQRRDFDYAVDMQVGVVLSYAAPVIAECDDYRLVYILKPSATSHTSVSAGIRALLGLLKVRPLYSVSVFTRPLDPTLRGVFYLSELRFKSHKSASSLRGSRARAHV
ncbi:hypothetical protein HPB50_010004 [Hyalomma asiaticum]|uniref:Uncharacterized protein n=1 Tax=Hyalomma asiaticum TaxID=266040 RepID=A0ACB7SUX9_HYAAI|nr:hypothetical protein HPB50_010004 [Hyalomma asiaticum]